MKVIAILNDSAVLNNMKTVLFPEKLSNEIRHLRETILSFQKKLYEKSQHIIMLETKVSGLEGKLDEIEQYGRRSNLSNEIRHLRETILSFQKKLDEKSQHIIMLETKVSGLEGKLDEIEQYGRRSNLIFSGFASSVNLSTSRTMTWVSLPPYSHVTSNAFTDWVERRTPFDRGR